MDSDFNRDNNLTEQMLHISKENDSKRELDLKLNETVGELLESKTYCERPLWLRLLIGPHEYVTPFNIAPGFLVLIYMVIEVGTGFAIANTFAMKQLLIKRDVLNSISKNELDVSLSSVLSFGLSMSIIGSLFAGISMDQIGPKITGVVSLVMYSIGWVILFFGPSQSYYSLSLGSAVLGVAFSGIFICHTSASNLFYNHKITVLGLISSGIDMSQFTTYAIHKLSEVYNLNAVVGGYIAICVVLTVIASLVLPWKSFNGELKSESQLLGLGLFHAVQTSSSQPSPFSNDSSGSSVRLQNKSIISTDTQNQENGVFFESLSLKEQLATPEYWVYAVIFVVLYFRKSNFSYLANRIFAEISYASTGDVTNADPYIDVLSAVVSLSFLSCIGFGWFTNKFGVISSAVCINTAAVLLYLCTIISMLRLQALSVLFYVIMSGYILGNLLAFLTKFYGYKNLGTLQGIMSVISFFAQLLWDYWWNQKFVSQLDNAYISNIILLAVGIAIYGVVILEWWLLKKRQVENMKLLCEIRD